MVEEKKIEKEKYELVEVPVQTTVVIKDNKNNTLLDDKQVLKLILDKLDFIERRLA